MMWNFKKFDIKYSTKNIPSTRNEEYKEAGIEKTQHLVRRIMFKAKFFKDESVISEECESYGFKTKRSPKSMYHLKVFEEDPI